MRLEVQKECARFWFLLLNSIFIGQFWYNKAACSRAEPNIHSSMLVCIDHGDNKESILKNNYFSMLTNRYCLEGLYAGPLVAAFISLYGRCQHHLPLGHQGQRNSLLSHKMYLQNNWSLGETSLQFPVTKFMYKLHYSSRLKIVIKWFQGIDWQSLSQLPPFSWFLLPTTLADACFDIASYST